MVRQVIVGRLVAISFVREDCVVCPQPIEVDQIARLDWQAEKLMHFHCVTQYVEDYIRNNPDVRLENIQVMFGLSRKTAYRRLAGSRNGTSS